MKGLAVLKALRLVAPLSLQKQGADLHLLCLVLLRGLGEDRLAERRQGKGQLLCDPGHFSHRRGA